MTELEKIEYTKGFVDKLAEGINPIDGTPIAEGDLLNNVRISRCMYYVSDILRRVIENGGPRAKSRQSEGAHRLRSIAAPGASLPRPMSR